MCHQYNLIKVEAPTRLELVNGGFANHCLTTWLRRRELNAKGKKSKVKSVSRAPRRVNGFPHVWLVLLFEAGERLEQPSARFNPVVVVL